MTALQTSANKSPLVSCICPTMPGRSGFLFRAIECFRAQQYPNLEMILVGDDASVFLWQSPGIVTVNGGAGLTLGAKRNLACERAQGEIICHFDDDDWSAPRRAAHQAAQLWVSGLPVTSYHTVTVQETRRVFLHEDGVRRRAGEWWTLSNPIGIGAALCYTRAWWQAHPFPAITCGEDDAFLAAAAGQITTHDGSEYVRVTNHAECTSQRLVVPGNGWQELGAPPA